ncbi:RagB/SusD family nutrient uptake outer membrane protein [Hymenobacter psoromatis]|uniref:RagB/SusD family nutrient uptake outer membrane protein n=1 Tax=Hymenobacter psoromatis TaxID=1484116 RepID=UPI001CBD2F68|nr:RagB/SusD family nutrient uptake outer membrane protein [Hymenobacter psoromatis]
MYLPKKAIGFSLLTLGLLGSCGKSYLELQPRNALSTDQFYQTQDDAIQATNSTYAQLRGYGMYGEGLWSMDIMADNSFVGGGGAADGIELQQLDTYTIPSSNPITTVLFQRPFLGIGACNQVLANVPGIKNIDPAIQNRCLGEAEFMRAFYYFSLTRLFGDVPIVLTPPTSAGAVANVSRDPSAMVYAQVEKDLLDAITKLPATNYTGDDVGRANKWSATALLAKVYLTEGKMAEAATQAQAVISGSGKSLWPNYGDNFNLATENGQESLFEVQYKSGLNQYTLDGPGSAINEFWGARFFGNPYVVSGGGYGFNIPEKEFVDGYEPGDLRKAVTLFVPGDKYPDGQVQPASLQGDPNGYNVRKFYAGAASTIWDSPLNVPVLRLAEMYLILAEADMNTGKMADGLTALNVVRKRAGLPNATTLSIDVVLKERRYELAFEMDRWYDLKRTKTLVNNPNLIPKGIKPFNDLLPIPQVERDVNPNLGQNPGY